MTIELPTAGCLPELGQLWKEAFGDTDAFLDSFFATAFSPRRCRCALEDGQVAAVLYWFDCLWEGRKVAYLYGVATAKAYRGRGLCHALMEQTHWELAALDYAGAVLVPGEESLFRFYESMGYEVCGFTASLSCEAAQEAAGLRQVDAAEYARLRRKLLPPGGVVQEGENLTFLQTHAQLYAGEGFVVAATEEEGNLRGQELLGDVAAAPGIVRALGCARGEFRIPGREKAFAMYRSLDGSGMPAYFGLAFD